MKINRYYQILNPRPWTTTMSGTSTHSIQKFMQQLGLISLIYLKNETTATN